MSSNEEVLLSDLKKESENRSARFEPNISLISFSRGQVHPEPNIGELLRSRGFLVSTDLRQPGVDPSTFTTTGPGPSSSSSNGPTNTLLTTRGFCTGGSVV